MNQNSIFREVGHGDVPSALHCSALDPLGFLLLDMKEIPLHGKYGTGKVALVDDDDFLWLSNLNVTWIGFKSKTSRTFYASCTAHSIMMHQLIMRPPIGMQVDHANWNGLDNRKSNLRIATGSENMVNWVRRNSTGFRGVRRSDNRFVARIKFMGIQRHIGSFATAEEAARAYDAAAIELHGKFAVLNFPKI